jgi:CxxC motif-containing protein (DUF1111 family)
MPGPGADEVFVSRPLHFALLVPLLATVACDEGAAGPEREYTLVTADPTDVPVANLTPAERATFDVGDASFELRRRDTQGVGPIFIRRACASCHDEGLRGPGRVQKMVQLAEDGMSPAPDQPMLPYGETVRPYSTLDTGEAVVVPADDENILVTSRLPPAVLGRGYMEAVLDSEIERVAAAQAMRTDGISGRINRVTYDAAMNPGGGFHAFEPGQGNLIGRFGLKAARPALDDFVSRAFLLDIGLTSPLRPSELPAPEGSGDDAKPGVDLALAELLDTTNYVRTLAIPGRGEGSARGRELFDQVKCSVCHVPSMRTRKDYPIAALADMDAPVYTDFLLHDRGPSYADGVVEGSAQPSEWRTAPLIALRFFKAYLHDGSAHSVSEAIAAHAAPGSETAVAATLFFALPSSDQAELVKFVESL